jgi:protein O-mannosyl-transferase
MALKYWHDAITLNPNHQKAWANILALLDNQGNANKVIETSEAALKFLPNEPTILFSRANAFGKLKNFTESEKLFRQIIELKPDYALYHANLGVLYHRWNRKALAMEYYTSALKLDPGLLSAKENLMKLSRTG